MEDPIVRRRTSLLEAEIGLEIVALHEGSGTCFGFNETAAWVWRALEHTRRVSELTEGLRSEFDVADEHCELRLRSLLDDLKTKGLVEFVD